MCKSVEIFSLGIKYGLYPSAPIEENETQFIFDVRHIIPDPYVIANLKKPGTDLEVIEFVKKHIENWLPVILTYIKYELINWLLYQKNKKIFKIYFTCTGGWQRSVVVANIVAEKIKIILSEYPSSKHEISVTVQHLTMELTRTIIESQK